MNLMMNDEMLRTCCKQAKVFSNISYKTIANEIGVSQDSFYSWIKGNYDFSYARARVLEHYLSRLKEV